MVSSWHDSVSGCILFVAPIIVSSSPEASSNCAGRCDWWDPRLGETVLEEHLSIDSIVLLSGREIFMGSVGMHPTTGSRPSADILHRLVWEDNPEELRRTLLQYQDHYTHDEKTGAAIPFSDTRFRGTTALGLAAQLGRKGCINVLLEHWADTLEFSDLGYLPLQEATSLGDRDMMRSLLLRRHEQLQQLWKIRQPALSEALHSVWLFLAHADSSHGDVGRNCPTFSWKWIGTFARGFPFLPASVPATRVEYGSEAVVSAWIPR